MHATDEEKLEVFGDDVYDSQGWLKIYNIYFLTCCSVMTKIKINCPEDIYLDNTYEGKVRENSPSVTYSNNYGQECLVN